MSEVAVLLPEADEKRDEAIFKDWRTGKRTILQLARDHGLPQSQITAILDRYLPLLTPQAQVRELRKLLHDLEELRCAYHGIAMAENDPEAANVSIRTTHEIAQLRMFVGGSAHNDPVRLERAAKPRGSSTAAYERQLRLLLSDGKPSPEKEARLREFDKYMSKPPEDEDESA